MPVTRPIRRGILGPTLLVAIACTDPSSKGPPKSEAASAPSDKAPKADAKKTPTRSLHAHMQEHFVKVDQLQKAVVAGDLEAAQRHARWVAEHEPHDGLPGGWEPYVEQMQEEARTVLRAEALSAAAQATARVAGTCGSCHAANEADLRLGVEPEPEMGDELSLAMRKHQWAADRLWDAVVSRSDELWKLGVEAMGASQVKPKDLEGEPTAGSDLQKVLARFRALAPKAEAAETPEARVEVLGAYLSTCVGCHGEVEKGPEAW